MDLAALESSPLPAHIPMQTKASVSIRIKEYLRYELLPLGVFVTAKIHRHIENPPEDTLSAIILDVHTTATMPWPSYKECLGARSKNLTCQMKGREDMREDDPARECKGGQSWHPAVAHFFHHHGEVCRSQATPGHVLHHHVVLVPHLHM
jgi:hypothetical protein